MPKSNELKGFFSPKILKFFNLPENSIVYIGEQNILHIKNKHYSDYELYYSHLSEIISSPDYVGRNLKDNSLELIKEFFLEEKKSYVKVAIRSSKNNIFYVRTLYVLNSLKFEKQVFQGYYKKAQSLY